MWLDDAARDLLASSRAFTAKNLYHAARRRQEPGSLDDASFRVALDARLAASDLPGLLAPSVPWHGEPLPREWDSYFPRAILLVDRPAILDLFVASGVLAPAKLAVVCIDGSPRSVIDWLARGFRCGHRAPVGYLHDAATIAYPYLFEPLAAYLAAASDARDALAFADLGLPPLGLPAGRFPLARAGDVPRRQIVRELEELPPCAMVAYATRRLLAMTPRDPMMAPLAPKEGAR